MTQNPSEYAALFDMVADALGALVLFAVLVCGIWFSHAAGLPTGGDELLKAVP
jgi:hypothetical protein